MELRRYVSLDPAHTMYADGYPEAQNNIFHLLSARHILSISDLQEKLLKSSSFAHPGAEDDTDLAVERSPSESMVCMGRRPWPRKFGECSAYSRFSADALKYMYDPSLLLCDHRRLHHLASRKCGSR